MIDENVSTPDYSKLPPADLVGLTAFTSQAPRAYELADEFRERGAPVVMGGIHATVCQEEAAGRVLSLPIYPELTDEMKDYVVGKIDEFY